MAAEGAVMEVKKGLILGDFDVIAVLSSVASNPIVLCLCRRFPGSKVSTSTRIRIQIEFARPRVSGFTVVRRTPLGILATEHAS